MYENTNTNPAELPQADDIMIVDRELGIIVYGVPGFPLGHVVSSDTEAEDFILEHVDDEDLECIPVWQFIEHTGQRDYWRYEWTERPELDAETIGCIRYHQERDQ